MQIRDGTGFYRVNLAAVTLKHTTNVPHEHKDERGKLYEHEHALGLGQHRHERPLDNHLILVRTGQIG